MLVQDETALERQWSSYGLDTLVSCDIFTETGDYLGKARHKLFFFFRWSGSDLAIETQDNSPQSRWQVRDLEFDPEDGAIARIFFDAWGLPLLPVSGRH